MPGKFKLPPSWYRETITTIVDDVLPPLLGRLTTETAWAYVYAITMWAEHSNEAEYLHLVESDKLNTNAGRAFANSAARYLSTELSALGPCNPYELVDQIGKAYVEERARQGFGAPVKKRDPNITGAAFETTLQVLVDKLCGVTPSRTPALRTLQGFELAPEVTTPVQTSCSSARAISDF